jgi:glucose-1-phosphate thymidylyltransferase
LVRLMPLKALVLPRPLGQVRRFANGTPGEFPPTPLVEMANRPLLDHALRWLTRGGVRDVAVLAPAHVKQTMLSALSASGASWPDVTWLSQDPSALTDFLEGERFVLHHADCLFRDNLRAVVGTPPTGDLDALVIADGSESLQGVIDLNRQRRRNMQPVVGAPSSLAVLGPGVAEGVALAHADDHEALPRWVREHGGRVSVRRVDRFWRFRDSRDALLAGNAFALSDLHTDLSRATLRDTRIEGPVVAEAGALLVSCVVRGPAVIGARARLTDSYVGSYTSIGRDAFIEGAEVEHSIILPGAHLSHLGTRLEGSVVGRDARVARDFHIPRALRVSIGDGAEISLS